MSRISLYFRHPAPPRRESALSFFASRGRNGGYGISFVAVVTALAFALASLPLPVWAASHGALSLTHLAVVGPDEDVERAKQLYSEAEGLAAEGNHAAAVPLYEEAYTLVPGKHGFAYKVGYSAYKSGDCVKAKEYFQHLVKYGAKQRKLADKVREGKQTLAKIRSTRCDAKQLEREEQASQESAKAAAAAPKQEENPLDDNPFADDGPEDLSKAGGKSRASLDAKEDEKPRRKRKKLNLGSKKTLILLTSGGVGVLAGATFMILARVKAKKLTGLATAKELGLTSESDYSCRVKGEPCPYTMERNLKRFNIIGLSALGVGGVLLAWGGWSWLRDRKKNKSKADDPDKSAAALPRWWVVPEVDGNGGMSARATLRF